MDGQNDLYAIRGASSGKEEVHEAIKKLKKGLYPGAFCKIFPDPSLDILYCVLMHSDGSGTKIILPYLAELEGMGKKYWKCCAQDSLIMNIDDAICVGTLGPFGVTGTIDRNKHLISGEVLKIIIEECERLCDLLTDWGIPCSYMGGETADVPDTVRTIVLNNTIHTRFKREEVIDVSKVSAPAFIVGFSSIGQAEWEDDLNSGIGSNGLTSGRHDSLSSHYKQFTETYSPETNRDVVYIGKHRLSDFLPKDPQFTILSALVSPTRAYAPLIKELFSTIGRKNIMGLVHCTGGGQTKIGKYGQLGITYRKDNLFPTPDLFKFLKKENSWESMYKTYNMGHRMEAIVRDRTIAQACIDVSESFGIDAQITGEVIENTHNDRRTVLIESPYGKFEYDFFE